MRTYEECEESKLMVKYLNLKWKSKENEYSR